MMLRMKAIGHVTGTEPHQTLNLSSSDMHPHLTKTTLN